MKVSERGQKLYTVAFRSLPRSGREQSSTNCVHCSLRSFHLPLLRPYIPHCQVFDGELGCRLRRFVSCSYWVSQIQRRTLPNRELLEFQETIANIPSLHRLPGVSSPAPSLASRSSFECSFAMTFSNCDQRPSTWLNSLPTLAEVSRRCRMEL